MIFEKCQIFWCWWQWSKWLSLPYISRNKKKEPNGLTVRLYITKELQAGQRILHLRYTIQCVSGVFPTFAIRLF